MEYQRTHKSFQKTLFRLAAPHFIPAGFWELLSVICRISMPLSLRELLRVLEAHPNQSVAPLALKYAIYMTLAALVGAVAQNRMAYLSTKSGIVLRAALTTAIYDHALTLDPTAREKHNDISTTTGEITNLMAIKTQKIYDVMLEAHNLWSCPLLIIMVTAFLWAETGPEMVVGVVVLILILPIAKTLVGHMLQVRKSRSQLTDARIGILASMLQGIRVTKLNHYEEKVEGAVRLIRDEEIQLLKRELRLWGWIMFMGVMSPMVATALAFMTYALTDPGQNLITPAKAFSSLLLLSILRFPLNMTARVVGKLAQASEGAKQIANFLELPTRGQPRQGHHQTQLDTSEMELPLPPKSDPSQVNKETTVRTAADNEYSSGGSADALVAVEDDDSTSVAVVESGSSEDEAGAHLLVDLRHGSFSINLLPTTDADDDDDDDDDQPLDDSVFSLRDIDLSLKPTELLMVVGKVGSGKTTLLNALLGELPAPSVETRLDIEGMVSYAPQVPFIMNQSVRNNVLFESELDQERYDRVLEACCLQQDLDLLGAARDLTQIGERGVTLSGGQKARVGLARACYASSDVVLLDDPFSALDSGTARAVFDGLFHPTSGILRNAGTILVTHAIHFLPRADRIIVLDDGRCTFSGTWNELKTIQDGDSSKNVGLLEAIKSEAHGGNHDEAQGRKEPTDDNTTKNGTIMTVEERNYGVSSIKPWLTWCKNAGGWSFFIPQLFILIVDRAFNVATDWWLAVWSDAAYDSFEIFGITFEAQEEGRNAQQHFVRVYALLMVLSVIAAAIRSQWSCKYGEGNHLLSTVSSLTNLYFLPTQCRIHQSWAGLDVQRRCFMP